MIIEPRTPTQLFLQNANFLLELFDDQLLVTIHPTRDAGHNQREPIHGQIIPQTPHRDEDLPP